MRLGVIVDLPRGRIQCPRQPGSYQRWYQPDPSVGGWLVRPVDARRLACSSLRWMSALAPTLAPTLAPRRTPGLTSLTGAVAFYRGTS